MADPSEVLREEAPSRVRYRTRAPKHATVGKLVTCLKCSKEFRRTGTLWRICETCYRTNVKDSGVVESFVTTRPGGRKGRLPTE